MSLNYITKDITTVTRGIVAHGVNAQRKMGSGVAKAIRDKWPIVYERYVKVPGGKKAVGQAHIINVGDELYVANCYTQLTYGHDGQKYASVEAIDQSLRPIFTFADIYNLPVYLPMIGAGLGGLDWTTEVEPVINKVASKHPSIDTYICQWP